MGLVRWRTSRKDADMNQELDMQEGVWQRPEGFNETDWLMCKGNRKHIKHLPTSERVFFQIWQKQQLTGEAFFHQEWLAKAVGRSVRQVQNALYELKETGRIIIERTDQNYYRIVEFYSRPAVEWAKEAIRKGNAALDKFYGQVTGQEKAKEPREGSSQRVKRPWVRKAKVKVVEAVVEKVELTQEERLEQERRGREALERMEAEQEARYEEERIACEEAPEELKRGIEEAAEEVARESASGKKVSETDFYQAVLSKARSYGLKIGYELRGLVGGIAGRSYKKHRYRFM